MTTTAPLGWRGIIRLGLAQSALGAVVVMTTSTLNRVMVVEMALPAMLPGLLVGWHFALQVLRPRMGYGSDIGGRRTPWIVGGICVLATGGILAAMATALMARTTVLGVILAVAAFTLIGIGVSAAGTSILVLLAKRVEPTRRPAAATIVWLMMIAGFAITATISGHLLDPFSTTRLMAVAVGIAVTAVLVTLAATWNIEPVSELPVVKRATAARDPTSQPHAPFTAAIAQVWAEPEARRFTIFVFVSMLAYSMQDLILEPFAGVVFAMTPGQSTRLGGLQHSGVFCGMVMVAVLGSAIGGRRLGSLEGWTIAGCIASACALAGLAAAGLVGPAWPLQATVFCLGAANGAFAIAAIGSMMLLAGNGQQHREGVRMGLWGAAQAIAFGLGGLVGSVASDIARHVVTVPGAAYATVFAAEAVLFLVAAVLAARITVPAQASETSAPNSSLVDAAGNGLLAEVEPA